MSVIVSNGSALASTSKKIGGSVSVWNEFSGGEATGFATALKPFESRPG
jgi:hypothetical protein